MTDQFAAEVKPGVRVLDLHPDLECTPRKISAAAEIARRSIAGFDRQQFRSYSSPCCGSSLATRQRKPEKLCQNMPIPIGSIAPQFKLKSKTPSGLIDVTLSDNLGHKNTVILFFPLAFTGVCTNEMCEISAGLNSYQGLGADIIGISVDSPFAQEAWAQKEGIKVRLASDLNKQTARDYGVLLDDLLGLGSVAARAAFVVDRQGIVRYSEQTPTPKELPNFHAIKACLESLR